MDLIYKPETSMFETRPSQMCSFPRPLTSLKAQCADEGLLKKKQLSLMPVPRFNAHH